MLGSGLSSFKNRIKNKILISYKDIPNFSATNVEGHEGMFIYGLVNNIEVLCASGRLHYYEGYTFDQIGSIIKIFNYYKPKLCIITNSSGCLQLDWALGDFMLIKHFIDFSFMDSIDSKMYKTK